MSNIISERAMQAAYDEIESLRQQLAAIQAREQKLRNLMLYHTHYSHIGNGFIEEAISLPQDTTALESMIAKAGEVMRKRALVPCDDISKNDCNSTEYRAAAGLCGIAIDAIPEITMDDLK